MWRSSSPSVATVTPSGVVTGSNAFWTRNKRLIFRVPHYKTDAALQAEYEEKLAAKTLPVMPGASQVVPAK